MITAQLDDTKSYYRFIIKITIYENERKNKQVRCILFEQLLLLISNILHFVLATVSQRLVDSNYFLVVDWSESQGLRL